MLGKKEARSIIAWDAAKLFACFVLFKAGSAILPVRSGAAELGTKDSLGCMLGKEEVRNIIVCMRQSSFCAFSVPLKLEVKFFQCAAVRLNLILKILSVECLARKKPGTSSYACGKALSVLFLLLLKLEAQFFQRAAVRPNQYLSSS
ncbi:MAG: hypothetical protein LBT59_30130 [Clostridiales bacterium]|jgi:hypothetical protein|nr:hypothetical protein [Clostridiales bacterium]